VLMLCSRQLPRTNQQPCARHRSIETGCLNSVPFLCTPTVSVAMSSPIRFREFSEDEYRKFIRTLSDQELIKAGKRLRILCGDVVTVTPTTFDRQLKICREEYRRRHPKWFIFRKRFMIARLC